MPKPRDYHLKKRELEAIVTAIRHDQRPEVRQRCTSIHLLHLGHKPEEIAEMQSVSVPSIYNWINRWRKGGMGETTTTINYTYDPLYRLTAADYSTGDYYHYTYDEVGNRLSQDSSLNNQHTTTSYTYDIANRMTQVGNNTYTWDNNGNLRNDGVSTYTYDPANRLIGVAQGSNTYMYAYNGLGDRLQQTVNGQATNYTLDLNAGLTQVLDDGTNTYTYGLDRISQQHGSTAEYYLDDALGSVRQLTDASSAITLSKFYDPYGNVIASEGSSTSIFGYTDEQTDQSGLTYLRARYYEPVDGRFTTRDTWGGDANQPMSYDHWIYVEANPINATDPSGYITEKESKRAELILEKLNDIYNVHIEKDWGVYYWHDFNFNPFNGKPFMTKVCEWENGNWRNIHELELVLQAVKDLSQKIGPANKGAQAFKTIYNHVLMSRWSIGWSTPFSPPGHLAHLLGDVGITDYTFNYGDDYARFTIVHELGHVWDYRSGNQLSFNLMKALHSWVCSLGYRGREICYWDPSKSIEPPPDTKQDCVQHPHDIDCLKNPPYSSTYGGAGPLLEGPGWEDWAQSLAYYVYPNYAPRTYGLGPIRRRYVEEQIRNAARLP